MRINKKAILDELVPDSQIKLAGDGLKLSEIKDRLQTMGCQIEEFIESEFISFRYKGNKYIIEEDGIGWGFYIINESTDDTDTLAHGDKLPIEENDWNDIRNEF